MDVTLTFSNPWDATSLTIGAPSAVRHSGHIWATTLWIKKPSDESLLYLFVALGMIEVLKSHLSWLPTSDKVHEQAARL